MINILKKKHKNNVVSKSIVIELNIPLYQRLSKYDFRGVKIIYRVKIT